MFSIAFLIGLYVKGLYVIGLLQQFTILNICLYTISFILLSRLCWKYFDEKIVFKDVLLEVRSLILENRILGVLLSGSVIVVGLGILVPETTFDSLWYHLTLPKLYLSQGGISFIPGSLFYYSALPKVGELLYLLPVAFKMESLAKFIHALFGIGTCLILYQISKSMVSKKLALLSVIVFLGNIVVLWQATTTYIDLIRTFFEILSLYGLILYARTDKKKWLIESAISLGLAVETKLIAIGTLLAHVFFIFIREKIRVSNFKDIFIYGILVIFVPLPWFVFSYIHTGNPIYPIFSGYPIDGTGSVFLLIKQSILIFVSSSDPVSPIYLALLPLIPIIWKRMKKEETALFKTALICFIVWILTPKTGGGRFILPYLPLFSICVVTALKYLSKPLVKTVYVAILLVSVIAITYRSVALLDDARVILGLDSKHEYLSERLNYNFGDFYDTDNYFKNNIKPYETVLLVGFHNLYYVDFKYIDQSFQKGNDIFTYVATQNAVLPKKYQGWEKIYFNSTTHVNVYKKPSVL